MDKSREQQLIKWLKQQQKACGRYVQLTVLLGVANGLALVAQAYLLADVLQGVIMAGDSASAFVAQYLALVGLFIARAALAYGRERLGFMAGMRLRQTMRAAVLDKLARLGPAYIKGRPAGSWASMVLEQVEDLQDFYARYLPQMSLAAMIPVIILLVVFPLNWAAGAILLLTAPLIPLFMILVGWGAAEANRKNFQALSRLSGHFMDRLSALSTLKLFYRGQAELGQISSASEEFRSRTMSVLKLAFLSSAVLEFFAAVSIAVLAVYFGFSYLGHLNFGHYGEPLSLFVGLFVLILAPEFYQPLRDMGTHYHAKAQAVGAAESVLTLLSHDENLSHGDAKIQGALTIRAHKLMVMSHDDQVLLGPISFELTPEQTLTIVGPSGAGKSTLINALLGFLPYKGQLTVNGVELKHLDMSHWRQQVAWLGQEPQLFFGSVRDNVAMGMPELSDDDCRSLLAAAHIAEFQDRLTEEIDEHSGGISVGQAQRLALARALALSPRLYLLDEPTASLDFHSEQQVIKALTKATAHQGCLLVTHRLDLLQQQPTILVLDQGLLVQQGSFEQLAHTPGVFKDMLSELEDDGVMSAQPRPLFPSSMGDHQEHS
ncbi:cysteine/glutathione ABC transporter permease/ATP-binding protein CydD [Shewanella sp. NIFS-20-20]|uniref:heme ABC transporter permease/ATP-binding protein CydD n=1 Tax=Shewanella sp. NIFS-20-20 TaxID=2853806 RepID=UPI001C485DB1|nr:cysteine/glutathione ABC transporter permease/ATP-binding protein CydD [Shewanella sp. NIFS-20-20]MBV7314708.1 cysteine/glutathione ABC transporter permease/ATP-binding protein CydD [Shewanella sp. NIFS-20-20]